MCDKSVHDLDCELYILLDGREEEQPELFRDLIGRDGEVSAGDLSALIPGDLRVSDSLCVRQLLSGRLSVGQRRNQGGALGISFFCVLMLAVSCMVLKRGLANYESSSY